MSLDSNRSDGGAAAGDQRISLFPTSSPAVTSAGALGVLSFCLAFMLPWWNRYLGLTNEGWLHFYGWRTLQGAVPYRHFYLYVPPGHALTMAALIAAFGNRIVVGEIFGLIAALAGEDAVVIARFEGKAFEGGREVPAQTAPDRDPVPGRLHVPSDALWVDTHLEPQPGDL